MRTRYVQACAAAASFVLFTHAIAADGPPSPRQERVNFAKGASSATIKGAIKGDATTDYRVRAAAGQKLDVRLDGGTTMIEFNVLPPGSKDVAMYSSNMTGNRVYSGVLPADGDYAVRVFLTRPAARRGESSKFTLSVGVSGQALAPLPASKDAKVGGSAYHATAQVNCVPPYASAATQCDTGVIRRSRDGTATVEVRGKNNLVRRLLFVQGKPIASDATDPFTSTRKGDVTTVKVGSDERYDIPDALLTGG